MWAWASRPGRDEMPTSRRPDILIVMADQMAPSALPLHGNPVTRTPAMSWLAESGVVFDAAYTASPLCSPGPGIFHDQPAAIADPHLRQRGGVHLRDPHLRPLPAQRRLPDRLVRQDALLRARIFVRASGRSATWFRSVTRTTRSPSRASGGISIATPTSRCPKSGTRMPRCTRTSAGSVRYAR